jgi:hypothetical protein
MPDMNTDFASWLFGMSLGASASGGMLGIADSGRSRPLIPE